MNNLKNFKPESFYYSSSPANQINACNKNTYEPEIMAAKLCIKDIKNGKYKQLKTENRIIKILNGFEKCGAEFGIESAKKYIDSFIKNEA